jgi:hypothetical protein
MMSKRIVATLVDYEVEKAATNDQVISRLVSIFEA